MTKNYPKRSNNTGVGNRPWKVKNDLFNKKFGKLKPIKIIDITKRGTIWECQCDCGKIKNVSRSCLISGSVSSCGCLKSDIKKDNLNLMWKGEKAGYAAIHNWVRSRLDKPDVCPICKIKPPIDLSNIGHTYKRDLNDWIWLCRKCHIISDGRMKKLVSRMKGRKEILLPKICHCCGIEYNPTFKKQKGCSTECSKKIRIESYVKTIKNKKMQGLYETRCTKRKNNML